jgi:hypothetical protein
MAIQLANATTIQLSTPTAPLRHPRCPTLFGASLKAGKGLRQERIVERRWLKLARSYQLFERMKTLSAHEDRQRGELSDRLAQLKHKLAQDRR